MTKNETLPPALFRLRERGRKAPRWVHSFLRGLERCGVARAAAEDAGVDHTTAYARRRAHADFAADWAEALATHKRRREAEEAGELEGFTRNLDASSPSPGSSPLPNPSPAEGRGAIQEELTVSNGQVKRVGPGRWNARREQIFFDELAATNNIRRSAAAAGVSYNAVMARRLKHPLFRAKWQAVAEAAKAGIGMYLLEASKQTFDPDTMQLPEAMPKVTIAEAIRISEAGSPKGGAAKGQAEEPGAFEEEAQSYDDEMADIREQLVRKLQALRRRDRPDKAARGWSYDESWDVDIPPGWVKGPDWRLRGPADYY